MATYPVPFSEPWQVTARRTGLLALAVGIGAGVLRRQLLLVPLVTVVALWFTLGGHFVELLFRDHLGAQISGQGRRKFLRLVYWFVGGSALYAGALATVALVIGRRPAGWPWWVGGVGFTAVELIIHLPLRARGLDSFYNGLG